MAPARSAQLRNLALGVIGTIVSAMILGGWNSKESVAAHKADVDSLRYEFKSLQETSLETLCEVKPKARKCQ